MIKSVTTAMIFPILDLLVKHGNPVLLGWLYILAFCMLGIIEESESKTATVIANIRLSSLLMAASGILHHSNSLGKLRDAKIEWAILLALHILNAGAIIRLAVGASAIQSSSTLPFGIALLTIDWTFLVGWAVQSWFRRGNTLHVSRAGREILIGVALALLSIGIRVLHTLVAFVTQKKSVNPITGTLAVRVALVILPEQAALYILLACVWIRNANNSEAIGSRQCASGQ